MSSNYFKPCSSSVRLTDQNLGDEITKLQFKVLMGKPDFEPGFRLFLQSEWHRLVHVL